MEGITIERYTELVRKEFVYDYLRADAVNDAKRGYCSQDKMRIFELTPEECQKDE